MSKMLEALCQIRGQGKALPPMGPSGVPGSLLAAVDAGTQMADPRGQRDEVTAGKSPEDTPSSQREPQHASLAMSPLERDVMHAMQSDRTQRQMLQLTAAIDQAAAGDSAAVSFHTCAGEEASPTLLLQTALAFAKQKRTNVVVVDADTHRQELTQGLGADGQSGLIEIFNGVQRWREVIRPLALTGVAFLPAGRGVLGKEGSGTLRLGRLIDRMRSEIPLILVYAGSDAGHFMQFQPSSFRASYLVLQLGQTTPQAAQSAIDTLQSSEFQVSGCVVAGAA
ncbi:MAG: hypothetical protein CL681_10045 [Blastopirellula sp.]|nr:hypothetical protein [Blastopirellula sp.]